MNAAGTKARALFNGQVTEPATAVPTFESVPDDLKERDQWVLWRSVKDPSTGKLKKLPFQCNGRAAAVDDPLTWSTFEAVETALSQNPGRFSGIGFVFAADDPFCGIDLDNCLTADGQLKPWAQPAAARFFDTYAEVSPSHTGIKIWCKAQLAGIGKRRPYHDGAVEVYDRGRFFTVTGQAWRESPAQIEEHQADVTHLYAWATAKAGSGRKYDLRAFPKIAAKLGENDPSRHEFLKTQAARLRNLGMGFEEMLESLRALNKSRCDPPKPDKEVEDLARYYSGKESWAERKPVTAAAAVGSAQNPNWRDSLLLTDRGAVRAILANAVLAIEKDPAWQGVLRFNDFAVRVEWQVPPPWPKQAGEQWTDNDDRQTAIWLQREGIHVPTSIAGEAVQTAAFANRFHPLQQYLRSLRWDGEPRLDLWTTTYLGTPADNEIARTFGRLWLISAVARALNPGQKVDCALILEGPQGKYKSRALRILGGEWFTDQIADLGTKDSRMQCHGAWIIELAELDSISRGEQSMIKSFMSAQEDRFRLPYGKQLVNWKRECVFAGSTNQDTYLRDETGARRFWPVHCEGAIDVDGLERDRDQLWAEAVTRYEDGAIWWLDDQRSIQQAQQEQSERYEVDPWSERISEVLATSDDEVTTSTILQHIGKPQGQWTRADEMRVAAYLRSRGWERYRYKGGTGGRTEGGTGRTARPWLYRRPQ